jgi:hypothetical protein
MISCNNDSEDSDRLVLYGEFDKAIEITEPKLENTEEILKVSFGVSLFRLIVSSATLI